MVIGMLGAGGGTAGAAPDASGYGDWSVADQPGTMTVPLAGFPSSELTTTSTSARVGSGSSAFLGASTPFGETYGSSQGREYLLARTAAGGAPSITTVTFAAPTPVGWGFALGDVDADTVRVAATDANGSPVPPDALGWQDSFNYCRNSPRPSTCAGPGPFTDAPRWDPATATLTGNGADTSGAAGWFRPTVPLRSLTLTFSVQRGIPVYQVWTAALPVSISGTVGTDCGAPVRDTTVRVLDPDGEPVRDNAGDPVTTTATDGSYSVAGLVAGTYRLAADAAGGNAGGPGSRRTVEATEDTSDVALTLRCPAPPPAPPTSTPSTPPSTPPESSSSPTTPPSVAPEISVSTQPGTPTTIRLPDGHTATQVEQPEHGSATVNADGSITYVPDRDFLGADTVRYTARTPSGATVTGVVTVTTALAATGVDVLPLALAGGVLVAVGAGALLISRRRATRHQE